MINLYSSKKKNVSRAPDKKEEEEEKRHLKVLGSLNKRDTYIY